MATALTELRITNNSTNPITVPGAKGPTVQALINAFRSWLAGPSSTVTMQVGYNAEAATGAITLTGATTSCTATINGVETADCIGADDNATALLLVAAINAETDPLVAKQVTSARTLTAATGTFTCSGATGSLQVTVGGTNVTFSAAGDDAADALALAAALNANGTVAGKVTSVATPGTGVVVMTAVQNEATGGRLGNAIALVGATGVTRSATTLAGGLTKVTLTSLIPGFAGNTSSYLATAGGGTIAPTSATLLTGGTETQETLTFP